jgi:hypothetical protein
MVSLVALAHDRGCEAELVVAFTEQMAGLEAAGVPPCHRRSCAAGAVRGYAGNDAWHRRQSPSGRQLRSASPVERQRQWHHQSRTARLPLLLRELQLLTIATMWQSFTERADREGWPAARLLAHDKRDDARN